MTRKSAKECRRTAAPRAGYEWRHEDVNLRERIAAAALTVITAVTIGLILAHRVAPLVGLPPAIREIAPRFPAPLRLDALSKVQSQRPAGDRNLFQYAEAPATPPSHHSGGGFDHPEPGPPPVQSHGVPAPSGPVYYGYIARRSGSTRGFFSEDGDIYVVAAGGQFSSYRVVSIDARVAVLEHTGTPRQSLVQLAE